MRAMMAETHPVAGVLVIIVVVALAFYSPSKRGVNSDDDDDDDEFKVYDDVQIVRIGVGGPKRW